MANTSKTKKNLKVGDFFNVNLYFPGSGYGSNSVRKYTYGVITDIDVKVKGERKRKVKICCITTGEQTTPFILIDKNGYIDKNSREVTLEQKVTREIAVDALKKEWADVPFDCKIELARAFKLEYKVDERKIITGVYLIPS